MSKEALAHLRRVDKKLARYIDRIGPCLLEAAGRETYPALLRSIVYQQLTGKAAATIHGRVLALFPKKKHPTAADVLALVAKDPAALRSAGLSRAKSAALVDLCERVVAKTLPTRRKLQGMSDEDIVEALTVVRGIGPWSAEMLLIFNLGRPDVFPVTDYGIRKGYALLHGLEELPSPKELMALGEKWRPFRSVASWYLWRITDLK
jgi:3-methyladenine DNA glycosylase/8-oxoguanine DNA glycosylase